MNRKPVHRILPKRISTETKIYGAAGYVEEADNDYYFHYLKGGIGGGADQVKITETEFLEIKSGTLSFDILCTKYNVG